MENGNGSVLLLQRRDQIRGALVQYASLHRVLEQETDATLNMIC